MREIKFRAWDKSKKEWIEDFSFVGGDWWIDEYKNDSLENKRPFENSELMQYTGFKDKNGKEIYEGDIVIGGMNYSGEQFYKGYIHWFADGAEYWASADFSEFGGKWNDRFTKLVEGIDEDDDSTETDTLEIIGNIYENPELIK